MSSLAPPSPSVSPAPGGRSPNFRASMGPSSARPVGVQGGLSPASPRPGATNGGARPTSELLGGAGMFQTPEGEYSLYLSFGTIPSGFGLRTRHHVGSLRTVNEKGSNRLMPGQRLGRSGG